jgi:hypothetical protein
MAGLAKLILWHVEVLHPNHERYADDINLRWFGSACADGVFADKKTGIREVNQWHHTCCRIEGQLRTIIYNAREVSGDSLACCKAPVYSETTVKCRRASAAAP